MPNGHGHKEYGEHAYADHISSDCAHGCGCWMGSSRSGGPVGLDPGGACPKNPKDGILLGGEKDYEYVVTSRIDELSGRAYRAEQLLKAVEPGTIVLAQELAATKEELFKARQRLASIRRIAGEDAESSVETTASGS